MSNYVRNFGAKNYQNQTTIHQLIANNISGCFFLKHGVYNTVVHESYQMASTQKRPWVVLVVKKT